LVGTSSPSIGTPAADGCRLSSRTSGVGLGLLANPFGLSPTVPRRSGAPR
jgi:hypothetical protein